MKTSKLKKLLAAALTGAMALAACPAAFADEATPEDSSVYVLMNIPYASFYDAEGDDSVDAVASATLQKTRTGGLAAGSYHVNADGSDITGVTYSVKTDEAGLEAAEALGGKEITDEDSVSITTNNRGQEATTVYSGSDALFEAPSYSYYVLDEAPAGYKEMTVSKKGALSFGASTAETTVVKDADATFSKSSSYGDYQLNVNFTFNDDTTIYGVLVGTTDGAEYGLRHIENIWRNTALAWSTGNTTNVHGSPLTPADYVDMEGKTINTVTYLTSEGNYLLKLAENDYVAPYYPLTADENAADPEKISVAGVPADARSAKASVYYQEGRTMVYAASKAKIVDGVVELDEALDATKTYTVKITSSNYADVSATVMAENAITCAPGTKTFTKKAVKKAAQTFAIEATNNAEAAMTFTKKSGNKKITVAEDGTVTVKKGLGKGTYKVSVIVKAAQTGKYHEATKTVTLKVRIK